MVTLQIWKCNQILCFATQNVKVTFQVIHICSFIFESISLLFLCIGKFKEVLIGIDQIINIILFMQKVIIIFLSKIFQFYQFDIFLFSTFNVVVVNPFHFQSRSYNIADGCQQKCLVVYHAKKSMDSSPNGSM